MPYCSPAVTGSRPSSRRSPPARHGPRRSPGFDACAGSTRSPRSGCAPRSGGLIASSTRQPRRLSRDRPLGEHQRRATLPGLDHQGRLDPCLPALDRGRLPLSAPSRDQHRARAPPTKPAADDHQHRLAHATVTERALASAQAHPSQAQRRRCGRDRPRTRRLLLGDRPHRLTPTPTNNNPLRPTRRPEPPGLAHTTPRITPEHRRHRRPPDVRRKQGLGAPAYESDRTSRSRTPGPRRQPQPHHTHRTPPPNTSSEDEGTINATRLTTAPPHECKGATVCANRPTCSVRLTPDPQTQ